MFRRMEMMIIHIIHNMILYVDHILAENDIFLFLLLFNRKV